MLNAFAALLRDEPELCIAAICLSISNLVPMLIDDLFALRGDMVAGNRKSGQQSKMEGNDFKSLYSMESGECLRDVCEILMEF